MAKEELRGGSVYALHPGGWNVYVRSVYQGDGFRVDAVPFHTPWGECMHVMVQGPAASSWADKQRVKSLVAGRDRLAIEVFPPESELVDQADVYHLWVLPDGFKLPFGLEET